MLVAFVAALVALPARAQADLGYLLGLLEATPDGGWVKASTNRYADAWATGPDALPPGSNSDPGAVVRAWSSFAWDPNRANLVLWGGGHANYMGNEVYVWQGVDGIWTRGSVSSRVERYGTSSTYFTVDNAAPQSAHTYDNNVFAPINDMFVTFGGAAFNSGLVFVNKGADGTPVRAGPWLWDARKADPNRVGGTTGSGYNAATLGGQMWTNLQGNWTGTQPPSHVDGNSAYRQENGRDVIYVTGDSNASGWPSLYRLELGDVRAGEPARYEKVGIAWYVPGYQSAATIDTRNGLYVRTSDLNNWPRRLGVWKLANNNAANPSLNADRAVDLVLQDGTPFEPSTFDGIAYDEVLDRIVLWDGSDRGTVWETRAIVDGNGNVVSPWTVVPRASTTASQPNGNFVTGVLGKWHYVRQLGAFVALDEYNATTQDAGVWLYKPHGWQRPGAPPATFQLSGMVTSGGVGLSGVAMAASAGASCTSTGATGSYACTVPSGWTGTVTPSLAGYTFAPVLRSYANVTADAAGQDYVGTLPSGETVWVEDAAPAGSTLAGTEPWVWVTGNPAPYSGASAHQSQVVFGAMHQHYFINATATLSVGVGDTLYAYVYLDPANPPSEVMLQWNDGTWEHRAYWGADQIAWGTNGTASRRYMGALPAVGQWVRLEVPASQVGLEGRVLNGMAFTLFGGRATWDQAGKSSP